MSTAERADVSDRPFAHATQLALPGLGPNVGGRWRNRYTGTIAVVLGLDERRYGWVTIRTAGERQTLKISQLLRSFERT